MTSYQENFNCLPRVVLEFSARDQLASEAELFFLRHRVKCTQAEIQNVASSLEVRERDCVSLRNQVNESQQALQHAQQHLRELQDSRSWKITSPLRALLGLFRSIAK